MANCPSILNTSPTDLEKFWQEHIKLKEESGLSRASYCRKHDLICSRFAYWERKLSQFITAKLLPIKLESTTVKTTLCTLVLKNGNELKIHDLTILPNLLIILG